MSSEHATLVADIGGTNARFALARRCAQHLELQAVQELHCADFPGLAEAARHYLARQAGGVARSAVLAVAAPVSGETVAITNNPWRFTAQDLRAALQLEQLRLINDFAAVAYALPELHEDDLQILGPPPARLAAQARDARYAVLGPGTGLGVAGLLRRHGESLVQETEGGHLGFAPGDAEELRLLEVLMREHPRLSWERLLSGMGLRNLYRAYCSLAGLAPALDTPAQISEAAGARSDAQAQRAVERFCELLGSFAGDVVLAHGAWDGVYLAGGITPRLLPWLRGEGFRRRFAAKGRFRAHLEKVPTLVITHPQVGLLGAAAAGLT